MNKFHLADTVMFLTVSFNLILTRRNI